MFFLSIDILCTIQNVKDKTVYDQVVATIFDDGHGTTNVECINREGTKFKITLPLVKVIRHHQCNYM
jgi:hypothetical protein